MFGFVVGDRIGGLNLIPVVIFRKLKLCILSPHVKKFTDFL